MREIILWKLQNRYVKSLKYMSIFICMDLTGSLDCRASLIFADMGEIVPFRVQILFLAGKKKVRSEAHRSKTFLRRIIYNLMSKK